MGCSVFVSVASLSRQAQTFLSKQLPTLRLISGNVCFLHQMPDTKKKDLVMHDGFLCVVDSSYLGTLWLHGFGIPIQTHRIWPHAVSIPYSSSVAHTCFFCIYLFFLYPFHTHAERCSLLSAVPCPCCTPAFGTSASCPSTRGRLGYTTAQTYEEATNTKSGVGQEGEWFFRISSF